MLKLPELNFKDQQVIKELIASEGWKILEKILKDNIEEKLENLQHNDFNSVVDFTVLQKEIEVLSLFIEQIHSLADGGGSNDTADYDPDPYEAKKVL